MQWSAEPMIWNLSVLPDVSRLLDMFTSKCTIGNGIFYDVLDSAEGKIIISLSVYVNRP